MAHRNIYALGDLVELSATCVWIWIEQATCYTSILISSIAHQILLDFMIALRNYAKLGMRLLPLLTHY